MQINWFGCLPLQVNRFYESSFNNKLPRSKSYSSSAVSSSVSLPPPVFSFYLLPFSLVAKRENRREKRRESIDYVLSSYSSSSFILFSPLPRFERCWTLLKHYFVRYHLFCNIVEPGRASETLYSLHLILLFSYLFFLLLILQSPLCIRNAMHGRWLVCTQEHILLISTCYLLMANYWLAPYDDYSLVVVVVVARKCWMSCVVGIKPKRGSSQPVRWCHDGPILKSKKEIEVRRMMRIVVLVRWSINNPIQKRCFHFISKNFQLAERKQNWFQLSFLSLWWMNKRTSFISHHATRLMCN